MFPRTVDIDGCPFTFSVEDNAKSKGKTVRCTVCHIVCHSVHNTCKRIWFVPMLSPLFACCQGCDIVKKNSEKNERVCVCDHCEG